MNTARPIRSADAIRKAVLQTDYHKHRRGCGYRGIEFALTFEQWFEIWTKSGHLKDRGVPGYCMMRHGGKGAFAVGNVSIVSTSKAAGTSPGTKRKKG
jgi:hypothetical protein